jgi:small subunit ribosomal protein S20
MIVLSAKEAKGVKSLPVTESAKKRMRQSEKRRVRNRVYRSRARTYVKRANRLIDQGKWEEATMVAQLAASALDTAAQKGVLHKKNVARRKSRLYTRLNRAGAENTGQA